MIQQEKALNVSVDIFEGPMDLLIYLIRKNNLDVHDIPISHITKEYLGYIEAMKDLNLDIAGEFLVMAATLMQIKANALLPTAKTEDGQDGPDPRAELADKIIEYQKFKQAAGYLDNRFDRYKDIFFRKSPMFSEKDKTLNIEIFELIGAMRRALENAADKSQLITGEEFPIEEKMEKIINALKEKEWILLDDIFAGERKRRGIIACFLAFLELTKLRKVMGRQDDRFGEIRIYLRPQEGEVNGEFAT